MRICTASFILLALIASFALAAGDNPAAVSALSENQTRYEVQEMRNPLMGLPTDGVDEDSVIYFEDFETEPTDWETQDLTDVGPQWHADPFNGYEGNSWWCGDSLLMGYYNLWMQYLDTPTLDLSLTANPQLTFNVRWAMESTTTSPPPPPYDGWDGCNVWISTDNGSNWDVLTPIAPAYTSASLSSFGTVWGLGSGIPGWADSSNGWLNASFDLSAYQNRYVKVRWALCSDRAVSSQGHPEITGFFVDDLLITDGQDTLLWNDADGSEFPGPMTFDTGPPFGDWWEWTTEDAHSPTHSMGVDDDNFYINNAIVSPEIEIPEGFTCRFNYWVHCDLPDSTHPGSTSLRDYYFVEASSDGVMWDTLFYDYARGGAGYPGWNQMVPGLPYNGNIDMDLSGYAGETIQLRFRILTDGDHTSGNGTGLFIDDVEVNVNNLPTVDVGIKEIFIPFPTTVGDLIEGHATVRNYGLFEQNSFYAFWRRDGELFPIGASPLWSLPGQTEATETISFTPTDSGSVFIDAYTQLAGDMNPANDTSWAGEVEIFPMGDWMVEDGFDARGYSYLETLLSLTYYEGNGPMLYFGPWYSQGWQWIRFMAWETGTLTAHFYGTGTATEPGADLGFIDITIAANEVYPNWKVVDISTIPQLGYYNGEFWVWIEMTQPAGGPALVADYRHFGEGRIFDYDGVTPVQSQYECYLRALGNDAIGVKPDDPGTKPATFTLEAVYPNPFNSTAEISFSLPVESDVKLSV
ncbi:immune inhibitor A, partial [bacterium]|nr:immune inhibitor A [bacterium]